jgi:hypothetical protein
MARWRRSESLVVPRSEIAWGLLALFFPAVGRALFFRPVFARALPFPIFFEGSLRAGVFRAVFFRAAFFVRLPVIYPLPFSHSIPAVRAQSATQSNT